MPLLFAKSTTLPSLILLYLNYSSPVSHARLIQLLSPILDLFIYFPKSSFLIVKIHKQYDFKRIFTSANKLTLSKLKKPIDISNSWSICSITSHCGPFYIGQTKQGLNYLITDHKKYIRKQEINKSVIVKHFWEINHTFDFNSDRFISIPILYLNLLSLSVS